MTPDWSSCDFCSAGVKSENLERHVREVHPEEYLAEYTESVGDPWVPCSVCHEWFESEEAVTEHVARKHIAEFNAEPEDACILCLRKGFGWDWKQRLEDADYMQSSMDDRQLSKQKVMIAATLALPDGFGVTADTAIRHVEEHVEVPDGLEDAFTEEEYQFKKAASEINKSRHNPTQLEEAVAELDEGRKFSASGLADKTGFSRQAVYKARERLETNGYVVLHKDDGPLKFEVTGKEAPDTTYDVIDESEVDTENVDLPTDHIDSAFP